MFAICSRLEPKVVRGVDQVQLVDIVSKMIVFPKQIYVV